MTVVTAWAWQVSYPGPSLVFAHHIAAAVRDALFEAHSALGFPQFPADFHGPATRQDHAHAHYLCLDWDEDGLVDEVMIVAACGLAPSVIAAAALVRSASGNGFSLALAPMSMGAAKDTPLAGPSVLWRALTPFVTSRHRLSSTGKERSRVSPERQLLQDLQARGIPPPEVAWQPHAWLGDRFVTPDVFAIAGAARKPSRAPPADAVAAFAILQFEAPVQGPIALGYGSHFGLGLFTPFD
jgi:CRISPR-associated protein Csb2